MPDRKEPVRRLVVGEAVLEAHRLAQVAKRVGRAAFGAGDSGRGDPYGHAKHIGERVLAGRRVGRKSGDERLELAEALPGLGEASRGRQRHRRAIQVAAGQTWQGGIRRLLGQQGVPLREAHVGGVELRHVPVGAGHLLQHRIGHARPRPAHGIQRFGLATLHGGGKGEELVVVAEVHGVIVERHGLRHVGDIRRRPLAVGLRRLLVATDALHDVRGHVLEVPGGRSHATDALGRGDGLLRMWRGLDRVDVVVQGAHVRGQALQYPLQSRDNLIRPLGGRPVGRPELPGMQVHQGLSVQRLHVEILRKALGDPAHRPRVVGEGRQGGGAHQWLRTGVAVGQRLDQRAFDGSRPWREFLRPHGRLIGDGRA